jgi:hypothetical protein
MINGYALPIENSEEPKKEAGIYRLEHFYSAIIGHF